MKKNLICFFIICLLCLPISAENSLGEEDNHIVKTNAETELKNEIENLEIQFEVYKDSYDRINSIVQWAFGLVFTMIAAFLGITGYNYHKNYKKDWDLIHKKLTDEYEEKINELLKRNDGVINDKISFLEKQLIRDLNDLKLSFLRYKFEKEQSPDLKLSISLEIINVLNKLNYSYIDWLYNDMFNFIIDCCNKGIFFDHTEFDEVKIMISSLPSRFEKEKNKLEAVIRYE